jgi:hypothetical protein
MTMSNQAIPAIRLSADGSRRSEALDRDSAAAALSRNLVGMKASYRRRAARRIIREDDPDVLLEAEYRKACAESPG